MKRRTTLVYAVGVGPGNPEYLTPRGERAIREADVVVGFTTVVEFVEDETDADLLTCGYKRRGRGARGVRRARRRRRVGDCGRDG